MRRRDFITLLGGGAVAAWSIAARAQQPRLPVIAFLNGSAAIPLFETAFSKGLGETGNVEGQNVMVEYHWPSGDYERIPALVADLVRRRVDVIATPGFAPAAIAAKAATQTIPIVFAVAEDPVNLGLVASLARPGANATGVNFFSAEVTAKRMELLHALLPKAMRIAVLANPTNGPSVDTALNQVDAAARALGLQINVFKASTSSEIDAAFAEIARERSDALFVLGDGFLHGRRVQLATLAISDRIPSSYTDREYVEAGGLISYAANLLDVIRQVGVYCGSVLKGAKPADLPVIQTSKFELTINLTTAKALGLDVPPTLLAIADVVIE
jgi:putative ABC transport system substrate-binding protein